MLPQLVHQRATLNLQQFEMLLLSVLIALIALHTGEAQVATAGVNHEQTDQQQQQQQQQHYQKQAEARQLFGGSGSNSNGFNANAAFSSNFGSSNFGLNFGGSPNANANQYNSGSYKPLTTRAPIQQQQQQQQQFPNYNNPANNFNSLNSITNQNPHKKEPSSLGNKPSYNDYNQKQPNSATRVIDQFNHHYPDGSYEYRYELTDGTARYERGYFLLYDNKKTLVVVGYYSYRMSDGRYITVFYNADQNGYRQNQSITPQNYPNLPRSIDVPQFRDVGIDVRADTTPNPRLTTTTTKRSGRF